MIDIPYWLRPRIERRIKADGIIAVACRPLIWSRIGAPLAHLIMDAVDQGPSGWHDHEHAGGSFLRTAWHAMLWSLSWHYLGDWLFYEKPMTETYWQSPLRIHRWPMVPRWMHVHRAPCTIVGYEHERRCTRG